MEQPPMVGFAPLTLTQLPLLHGWLQRPHVREFWDDGDRTLGQVQAIILPSSGTCWPFWSCWTGSPPAKPGA